MRFAPPLAPVVPTDLSWSASTQGNVSTFAKLVVDKLPAGGRVELRCSGDGCPLRRYTRSGRTRVDLRKKVRRVGTGARLEVRMIARGYTAKVQVYRFTRAGIRVQRRCIAPGTKQLRKRCG